MVLKGSDSKMLIFHKFFNGFRGSDSKMLIFQFLVFNGVEFLVFQCVFAVSSPRGIVWQFPAISGTPSQLRAEPPRGGFRSPFYHLKNL